MPRPSCTCCGAQTMTISCAANISRGRSAIQPQSSSWGNNCPSLPLIKGKTQMSEVWAVPPAGESGWKPKNPEWSFPVHHLSRIFPPAVVLALPKLPATDRFGSICICCLSCLSTEISGPQDLRANLGPTPSCYLMAGSHRESTQTHSAVACSEKVQ